LKRFSQVVGFDDAPSMPRIAATCSWSARFIRRAGLTAGEAHALLERFAIHSGERRHRVTSQDCQALNWREV
jgi:hypothetical protein